MSATRLCETCRHPITMHRCWRLTCPTNGAKESFAVAQRPEGDTAAGFNPNWLNDGQRKLI